MRLSPQSVLRTIVTSTALFASVSVAAAQTITFNALPGVSGTPFTGPYSEAGYTVTLLSGAICVAADFGNPVPDLFGGPGCSRTLSSTLSIKRTDGMLFRFASVELTSEDDPSTYSFAGLVSAGTVFSSSGIIAASPGFDLYTNPSSAVTIDELRIGLGTENAPSYNLDNITLTAAVVVPEPESFALVGAGLVALFAIGRKRRISRSTT